MHRLRISKYWPFPTYLPIGSCTSTILGKNATTINSVQSRILIDFSCTVTVFQNTSHSQRISLWEVVRTQFH
ncbi:hypothetical protein GW17_00054474 [Ensete ventricosum]|nr:hypothetical protein GW17_00054474 [Ensete ventricosum]